jgi:hypothetical protein
MEIANYRLNYLDISRPLPFLTNRGLWCHSTQSSVAAIPVYHEGKRPMGSLREIGWDGMDWIHVVRNREK